MSEITTETDSLPQDYRDLVQVAEERLQITIAPLQLLVGGWSGAIVYLISAKSRESGQVQHCILKLDRKRKHGEDEGARHQSVVRQSPEFAHRRVADLLFDPVEHDGTIALFYAIAGQSLFEYRPLSRYTRPHQLEAIFATTNDVLLREWNDQASFSQAVDPQSLLKEWLDFRLRPGNQIERFLRDVCHVDPEIAGIVVDGRLLPNPHTFARNLELWGGTRPIDTVRGSIHGDLNTNNILVKFAAGSDEIEGYYLIDFALFRESQPLLYDHRYLEMSYLVHALSHVGIERCIDLLVSMADSDRLDPRRVTIELSGLSNVLLAARHAFGEWVTQTHPTLHDDLWGQYWLAGVAAGLAYCHKAGLGTPERLVGLLFAAANQNRFDALFGVRPPSEGRTLRWGAASESAPTKASGAPGANNLPRQPTPFLGREIELESLARLLGDRSNRLITIAAPGGMGKTRLALQAVKETADDSPDGVFFVALDRISSSTQIMEAIADALPISLSTTEEAKSRVFDYLGDKTAVLLLDNCEHVIDGAPLFSELLAAAPGVTIVATSRVRLDVKGEVLFTIGGLSVHGSSHEGNAAVQLFTQSARQAQPDLNFDEATFGAAVRICEMVDGMPLAIVLAAAWADTLSVDEIAEELEGSIEILDSESRDVPDRQRSVREVINWTWNQIEPKSRSLLQKLSVFAGGFTRLAANSAAAASLRDLSHLVRKALVRRDPESGRYSMHELLRQYAQETLARAPDDERAARQAHAVYFAELMRSCDARAQGSDMAGALEEIEADIDNIRQAWTHWVDAQDAARVSQFLLGLWLAFEVRGSFGPAIALFESAAAALTADSPDVVATRARVRAWQAWFTALVGSPDEGLPIAQEAIETLRRLDDPDISTVLLGTISINAIFLNQPDIVASVSAEMDARAAAHPSPWEQAWASVWRGYARVLVGDVDAARDAGEQALAIFQSLDNPFGTSVASAILLGNIAMATGDLDAARSHLSSAVRDAEEMQYWRLLQICYDHLGTLALLQNDPDQAREYFVKSLRISRECGQTREMLASVRDLASVFLARDEPEDALRLLAVVLNHPARNQNSLNRPERLADEAEKMRVAISGTLDEARYKSAWARGTTSTLAEAVTELLA